MRRLREAPLHFRPPPASGPRVAPNVLQMPSLPSPHRPLQPLRPYRRRQARLRRLPGLLPLSSRFPGQRIQEWPSSLPSSSPPSPAGCLQGLSLFLHRGLHPAGPCSPGLLPALQGVCAGTELGGCRWAPFSLPCAHPHRQRCRRAPRRAQQARPSASQRPCCHHIHFKFERRRPSSASITTSLTVLGFIP